MNYEDMSDFEVNKAVSDIVHSNLFQLDSDGNGVFVSKSTDKYDFVNIVHSNFDPCNSPSDAWPVVESIWDELIKPPYRGHGTTWERLMSECDCGKLRAAMICFLKMKDSQNKPCKKTLADGQWYKFCGEFDMDSAPALCVNCGGEFKLKDAEK